MQDVATQVQPTTSGTALRPLQEGGVTFAFPVVTMLQRNTREPATLTRHSNSPMPISNLDAQRHKLSATSYDVCHFTRS